MFWMYLTKNRLLKERDNVEKQLNMIQLLKSEGHEIMDEPHNHEESSSIKGGSMKSSDSRDFSNTSPKPARKSTADSGAILDQKEIPYLDPLQQTLADEIKLLRDDYIKKGGSNPEILAQIEMLEEEAASLKSGNQARNSSYGQPAQAFAVHEPLEKVIPGEMKENEIKEVKLDHEMKMLQISQEKERIVCEQDLYKLKKELGLVKEEVLVKPQTPPKIKTKPVFPDKVMDVNAPLTPEEFDQLAIPMYTYDSNRYSPYLIFLFSSSGFAIFWDFIAGLPFHVAQKSCQILSAQFEGALPQSEISTLLPAKCKGDHQTYLIRAGFDVSSEYFKLQAKTSNRLIIELQVVSAENSQSKVVSGMFVALIGRF
jgi:hypothetical protein